MNVKARFIMRRIGLVLSGVLLLAALAAFPVHAEEKLLPSGIGYDEIEAEVDAYFKEHEATSAGLAYSVFDTSGEIAGGYYGYQDKENGIVVTDDTVFEWGSGSKMLVWVSVMQMAEQNALDLEADISTYLPEGFLTNLRFDTPVTMLHLMNHTAGFQDSPTDMSVAVDGYLTTLEEAVSAHKPEQIYEPGTVTAYSNWTTALAAYIVSRLSGMEFTEYVRQNIFEPLGMEHCAFSSNLHDDGWVQEERKKLQCYSNTGVLTPGAFYYCTLYPAGGCVSTFREYRTFAQALLAKSDRLMQPATWELFFTPSDYFGDSGLAKNCHGLWNVYFSVPTIGHIGKTSGCSSYILVDPESGVGAAVICNQGDEHVFSEEMMSLFFGDYASSRYYQADSLPQGKFLNAKMVAKGPFKLTGLLGTMTKDMTKEYWTVSQEHSPSVLEIAYMDYVEIPAGKSLFETVLLALFAGGVVLLPVLLIVRLFRAIFKAAKRDGGQAQPLRIWSVILSVLPVFVPLLFLMMLTSTANPSYTFSWIPVAIGAICVLQLVLLGYGLLKSRGVSFTGAAKVYRLLVAAVNVICVVNIFYWNLFMFWKI